MHKISRDLESFNYTTCWYSFILVGSTNIKHPYHIQLFLNISIKILFKNISRSRTIQFYQMVMSIRIRRFNKHYENPYHISLFLNINIKIVSQNISRSRTIQLYHTMMFIRIHRINKYKENPYQIRFFLNINIKMYSI